MDGALNPARHNVCRKTFLPCYRDIKGASEQGVVKAVVWMSFMGPLPSPRSEAISSPITMGI